MNMEYEMKRTDLYTFRIIANITLVLLLGSCASSPDYGQIGLTQFPEHCRHTGGMDRFRCVVDTHKSKINDVYLRHLKISRRFSGKLEFRVYLARNGAVRTVDIVQNTTRNTGFAEEVADNIRRMNFGPLRQERIFRYPLYFRPAK